MDLFIEQKDSQLESRLDTYKQDEIHLSSHLLLKSSEVNFIPTSTGVENKLYTDQLSESEPNI